MTGTAAARGFGLILNRCANATVLALAALLLAGQPSRAVEAVNVRLGASAIDMTDATELQKADGDRIQVSTAPGPDGIVRRIEVRAREANTNWAVFALTNNSDEQIDRLIVVPHYRMVGSGLFWPDLGLSRIASITPSSGDRPVRQENTTADIFRVTLDPGTVITFVAATKAATGDKGADVILDMVGGDYIARNYEAAAVEGRIVQIAFQGGPKAEVNFMRMMLKRLHHTGSTLRSRSVADKGAIARAVEDNALPLIVAGKVKPVIYKTFPLAEAAAAHALMETSAHIGKIVLTL